MGPMRRTRPMARILPCCLPLLIASTLSGGEPAREDAAVSNLARGLLDARISQLDRGLTTAIRRLVDAHELTLVTRQVVGGLSEDDNFKKFLQQKADAPTRTGEVQIGRFVEEYMQNPTNVGPDVSAWFKLTSDLRTPWANVYGAYQQL